MGSQSAKLLGAVGRQDMFLMRPEDLTLVTDPKHPLYDPSVHDEAPEWIVKSMVEIGYLPEPVVVRRNGEDKKTGKPLVEVVDGRHRTKSARVANELREKLGRDPILIKCITQIGGAELFGIGVALNAPKKRHSIIALAHSAQRQLELGDDEERVAICHRMTVPHLRRALKLLECSAQVQKAVEKGEIPAVAARKLASMPREEQDVALAQMREEGTTGKGKATKAAEEAKGPARGKPTTRRRVRTYAEVEAVRAAVAAEDRAPSNVHLEPTRQMLLALLEWVQGGDPRPELRNLMRPA